MKREKRKGRDGPGRNRTGTTRLQVLHATTTSRVLRAGATWNRTRVSPSAGARASRCTMAPGSTRRRKKKEEEEEGVTGIEPARASAHRSSACLLIQLHTLPREKEKKREKKEKIKARLHRELNSDLPRDKGPCTPVHHGVVKRGEAVPTGIEPARAASPRVF